MVTEMAQAELLGALTGEVVRQLNDLMWRILPFDSDIRARISGVILKSLESSRRATMPRRHIGIEH